MTLYVFHGIEIEDVAFNLLDMTKCNILNNFQF